MNDYLIGGAIVWLISALVCAYSAAMPIGGGDDFDFKMPLKVWLCILFLGPFSQISLTKAHNNVTHQLLKKSVE